MKRFLVRLLSLALVLSIAVFGFSTTASASDSLTGNYRQDTLSALESLRSAINLPSDSPEKGATQSEARRLINDFTARYRRDGSVAKLNSFTTMRTAMNSLAGHYSSYPNRSVPKKLKDRLDLEFTQVEAAINRGG